MQKCADMRGLNDLDSMPRLKDERARGFFWDHNEIFEIGLSPYAGWVRMYLIRLADSESVAFPSYNTIAEACCMSKSSARRAVEELIQTGLLIKRQRKKSGSLESDSNEYAILDSRHLAARKLSEARPESTRYAPTEHTYVPAEHTSVFSQNTPCAPTEHVIIPKYQHTYESYTDRQTSFLLKTPSHTPEAHGLSIHSSFPNDENQKPDFNLFKVVVAAYHQHIGDMGKAQVTKLRFWMEQMAMSPDVIAHGILVAAQQKEGDKHPPRISYIEGILRNWYNSGLTTVDAVMEHEKRLTAERLERERKLGTGCVQKEKSTCLEESLAANDTTPAPNVKPKLPPALEAIRMRYETSKAQLGLENGAGSLVY